MSTVPPWLHALVDDAAVFPPGNASLPDAVQSHREHRASALADLVGPLVLPADGVEGFRLASLAQPADGAHAQPADGAHAQPADGVEGFRLAAHAQPADGAHAQPADKALDVALVGTPDELAAAGPQVAATPSLRLTAVAARVPVGTRHAVDEAVATLRKGIGDTTPIALELPLAGADLDTAWRDAVAAASTHGVRVKLRTGGPTPEAFPTPHELATAVTSLVAQGVAFQCTAGLHHAVRAEDPDDGLVHHGFLNVLLATRASADGADVRTVATILGERSVDVLVEDVHAVGPDALTEARRWFTSFGSCSIAEPVADLRALGLL
ncbi:hypothetical protein FE697_004765 [Mumia zhuanghuii]|uniref:Transaldolase n=2 Tax=Mumia TaxID=1546255 RepID=A0ABW1QPD0_9ACTN|nr:MULTISPECIES: hypothetical protein [Mumia]KAA1425189.1 hypothetical protein FE697_004765 [Mumia zhuanghuii]